MQGGTELIDVDLWQYIWDINLVKMKKTFTMGKTGEKLSERQ